MLDPMRNKNERKYRGKREDTCVHSLSRVSLRVTSYELSSRIKKMTI